MNMSELSPKVLLGAITLILSTGVGPSDKCSDDPKGCKQVKFIF
tara:strand:- start:452 stop:583 length:132 start_codon:yes stop_codon:yes gene_type:complete